MIKNSVTKLVDNTGIIGLELSHISYQLSRTLNLVKRAVEHAD